MNLGKDLTAGLALIGLALGLSAAPADAESVLTGTFELSAAAYCGNTLLQPGRYTIRMSLEQRDLSNVPIIQLNGEETSATLLAIAQPAKESGRNYLDVVNINGTYVIRAFDAGLIGKSFAFAVTGNVKKMALRASAAPAMAVPVSAGTGF